MKVLKVSLVLCALFLFVLACAKTGTTNKIAANDSATAVSAADNSANATSANSAANDELASARKIYSENCVKCHKENGAGGKTVIEGAEIKAPNFASDRQKGKPDSDYVETIEKGAKEDGMPAFKGKISDEEIKNLVKYIRRDFQGKS